MAFGFFKKTQKADTIFTNGKIYTAEADEKWVEAVAVADGKIIALGTAEDIMDLEGADTEVVDLEGGTMLPGFIDFYAQPVLRAFDGEYLALDENADREGVLDALRDYVAENPDKDIYFAYGFDEKIFGEFEEDEDRHAPIDEICADKTVLCVTASGLGVWTNTKTAKEISEAAEDDNVQVVTLTYILSLFTPIDFDILEKKVLDVEAVYCEKGVTSVVNCSGMDYFDSVYQDVLLTFMANGALKQRYYGELVTKKALSPNVIVHKLRQKKTNCNEVEWGVDFNTLHLDLGSNFISDRDKLGEYLGLVIPDAADAGFDVRVDTETREDAELVVEIMEDSIDKGNRNSVYSFSCKQELDMDKFTDSLVGTDITVVDYPEELTEKIRLTAIGNCGTIEEAIDKLTVDAAILIGVEDKIGSIAVGKSADFAIFSENPFDCKSVAEFGKLEAVMTVLNGEIVYDVEDDNRNEWYELLTDMQM